MRRGERKQRNIAAGSAKRGMQGAEGRHETLAGGKPYEDSQRLPVCRGADSGSVSFEGQCARQRWYTDNNCAQTKLGIDKNYARKGKEGKKVKGRKGKGR